MLDGNDIANATVATQNNSYVVSLQFTTEGTEKFAQATERNVGSPIYIVYDGEIISAPNVNQTISNGQAVIEGNFTYESANSLATTIRLDV